jgi:hypothetical protein
VKIVTTPTKVGTDNHWASVSVMATSLGIKTDGTLGAWGAPLGVACSGAGISGESVNVPTQIGSDSDWSYVVSDGWVALALKADGTLLGMGI